MSKHVLGVSQHVPGQGSYQDSFPGFVSVFVSGFVSGFVSRVRIRVRIRIRIQDSYLGFVSNTFLNKIEKYLNTFQTKFEKYPVLVSWIRI